MTEAHASLRHSAASQGAAAASQTSSTSSPATASSTPPTITIAGNNPAHINIGDTYQDIGATAKESAGHDLGVKTFRNGALVSNIVLDTTQAATDTIDYGATDTNGPHLHEHPHRHHRRSAPILQ